MSPFARALVVFALLSSPVLAQPPAFKLAPAVALEAEDFQIEAGWKVVQNGHGNYMVDMVGFNHISGERLLCVDEKDDTASAFMDITVPEKGKYRLWVRYEYPGFCEARFKVVVQQGGKNIVEREMGAKTSPRFSFGELKPRAQYDQSWGSEGLAEEVVDVPELEAGKARIYLKAVGQPQTPGVAAGRHIDLLYLTRDLTDAWLEHYHKQTNLYPILDAVRDTIGARYEVRFTNRGDKPTDFGVTHVYNRIPWGVGEGIVAKAIAAGAASDWIPLKLQDTAHFSMVRFTSGGPTFDLEVRPIGGTVERKLTGASPLQLYLPPYPGKGDKPVTPIEALDAVLKELKDKPAPGKKPTKPLCYGGWMPAGLENDYGHKYAELYAALGFRSLHPALSGPAVLKNLEAAGVPPTKSWSVSNYRNPPTRANIATAKTALGRSEMKPYLQWFEYGDEIAFLEWIGVVLEDEVARAKDRGEKTTPEKALHQLWIDWLKANRPDVRTGEYWLDQWGKYDGSKMRPDSSAAAAVNKPQLYVDSLIFYEETAIRHVAAGANAVRAELGDDVLCGANYSCHPFYYPPTGMYVKWFRGNAADLGRHSEYVWQVDQPGPMINGYVAEHFRAGMRDNPRAVLRQYVMPHEPGNTDADFLRSCFTHLAHGATMLDFFGIGMNECFTENHIDFRAAHRYVALRDVTHCLGFVEDLLPASKPVASPVALLVSDSTERWDFAGIATDHAGQNGFGPNFRKTRLNAHLDRVGLWTALTFLGVSPDLLIEEDVNLKILQQYKVLVVVGDCLPPKLAPEIEKWVRDGGVVLATANAGRYDSYREPNPAFQTLFGLEKRQTEERTTFFRPRQELPFLKPLATVQGDGWEMPQLGTFERITPAKDTEILAKFKGEDAAAVVARPLGKGKLFYVAAQPGVAYLYTALQPPLVPDRGPNAHTIPTAFDPGARALLATILKAAAVEPIVEATPNLVDCRLLKSPKGFLLPIANYHDKVGQKVTLRIRVDGEIKNVTSAYHGLLEMKQTKGVVEVTIPELGYGDVLRLE